jgi:gas vesicle protein
MAYAPGAAPRTPSRTPGSRPHTGGRAQGNGRPASKRPGPVAAQGKRPSLTFLAGLGIGLAIGVAGAMLLAPRSGAETRRALRNRGQKLGNRARDAWEDLALELKATRRALRRKRRDAKIEIQEEMNGNENGNG